MSTARDLVLVALTLPTGDIAGQGDLSLALAGAEAIDLLRRGALSLDGDCMVPGPRVVPGPRTVSDDPLLDQADATLVRHEPYETIHEWLWRRGDDLVPAYADALERAGLVVHPHGHRLRLLSGPAVPADTQERREAEERRASGEPVLNDLLAALGVQGAAITEGREDERPESEDSSLDDDVTTVLAAVGDAVTELAAARLRRDVESAAFDNVWRGW
ncbi:Golgi phosphoprotein 3 GPP34 [Streptomyces sp. TLI_55]|uniref:GPP34 family phosphoprotein n=1 Tax=Streptomyces sp. TLI_55 TaxID=1938861 RepID=UPI000BD24068|nr:GPP34 family phosphoprotein [Streptomyces sp. TLI_55]SNX88306.1 Golgi phosphoprotein 3 GPP34 [Streptomyces sp. TLI_55]